MKQVVVIGVGAMGTALIAAAKTKNPDLLISVLDKDVEKVTQATKDLGVLVADNAALVTAELILLAVKPQDVFKVLADLGGKLNPAQTLLSIAAGVSLAKLSGATNATAIRCMPNTPALVGQGFATISANPTADPIHLDRAIEFLSSAGETLVIPEALQDSFTAIHGSGPAYVFLLIEALVDAAQAQGISKTDATHAVIATIAGAAELISQTGESASKLREKVTSPGGTTAAALAVLNDGGFTQLVAAAVAAAKKRAGELG